MIDKEKNKEQLSLDNSNTKKSSLKYALALAWLLSFSNVQADMLSLSPINLVTSPVYSFFALNIFHNILWDDDELSKNPKLQKTFNASSKILKKYIHSDVKNLKQINKEYLKLFTKIHKNKNYSAWKFVEDFIDLSSKQGLNYSKSMNLFLDYYNNHFFPENFSNKFAKDFEYKLWEYLWAYDKKEFEKRFQKLKKLYETWNLTKQSIESIFPEMKKMKEKEEIAFFILLWMMISFWGFVVYSTYKDRNDY